MGELLKRAGAPVGRDLSGKAVASYVRASAKDGYQVVFSLAELDPGFTANDIIVADTVDGKPLFDYQGPFRIVAPHDKRGARSIRMLQLPRLFIGVGFAAWRRVPRPSCTGRPIPRPTA